MPALAQSVTAKFPPETYALLKSKSKSLKMSVPKTLVFLIEDLFDVISDEEDKHLSDLVDEAERTSTGFVTHEEAWKTANAP
jgi:hypothetical protein